MDHLPTLTPVSLTPGQTATELQQVSLPSDTVLIAAEKACFEGEVSVASTSIERLLSNDAYHRDDLQGCLLRSVQSGRVSIVEKLLSEKVRIGEGVIKWAIRHRSKEMLAAFLKHGWNINQKMDWDQPPPLSLAVDKTVDPSFVSWLIEQGADPNAACDIDITALSTAVQQGSLPVIKLLLSRVTPTSQGQLLHHAAERTGEDAGIVLKLVFDTCHPEINHLMYAEDALAYEMYKRGGLGTALHGAARAGQRSTAQTLLSLGADASLKDTCGRTAHQVAVLHENTTVAHVLNIEKGSSAKM